MRLFLTVLWISAMGFAAGFTNGSFETNNNCSAGYGSWRILGAGSTCITGWVVSVGTIDYSNGLWVASHGTQSVELNGDSVGGIRQTFDTARNHTYRVTFDLAANAAGPPLKSLVVSAAGSSQSYTFDSTGKTYNSMGWTQKVFTFQADNSGSTTLQFLSTSTGDVRTGPVIDNVAVTDQGAARSGVLSHIAAGGGWTTTISILNTSASPVPVNIVLRSGDGTPLTLPVTMTRQGSVENATSSSLNAVVQPNTTWLITAGEQMPQVVVGWAEILGSGSVNGFAIFRQSIPRTSPSEGTVPLQSDVAQTIALPFDNTGGFVTGIALANLSSSSITIAAGIWDENGVWLGTQPLTLPANGHASFAFPDRLPATAGKRGIVKLQSSSESGLAGLGLRFSPFGTFTSVPTVLAQ